MLQVKTIPSSKDVIDVDPAQLERWLADGSALLIDVREEFEHAAEHIAGSHHHPLSHFDTDEVRTLYGDAKRVVFHCRSGRRSLDAARRWRRRSEEPVYHLAGGIEAWKAANLETRRSASAPRIDVMRQVQITAGSLVVIGVLLGAFVSPWFLVLSGFVGTGLVVAGITGHCGMALLLARMPWNRRAGG